MVVDTMPVQLDLSIGSHSINIDCCGKELPFWVFFYNNEKTFCMYLIVGSVNKQYTIFLITTNFLSPQGSR